MYRVDRMVGALGFTLTLALSLKGEGILFVVCGHDLGLAVAAGVLAGVAGGVEDGIFAGELLVHGGVAVGVAAKGRQGAGDEGQGRRADAELGEEATAGLAGLGVVLFRCVEFGCHVMLLRLARDRSSGEDATMYVCCRVLY